MHVILARNFVIYLVRFYQHNNWYLRYFCAIIWDVEKVIRLFGCYLCPCGGGCSLLFVLHCCTCDKLEQPEIIKISEVTIFLVWIILLFVHHWVIIFLNNIVLTNVFLHLLSGHMIYFDIFVCYFHMKCIIFVVWVFLI